MAERTFKSPGVRAFEIDRSGPSPTGPTGVPAGVIGTAQEGPAFVPLTVANFSEFESKFGFISGDQFGPIASQEWLRYAGSLAYVRVLGAGDTKKRSTSDGTVTNAGFVVGQRLPLGTGILGDNSNANTAGQGLGRTYFLGCYMSESNGSTIFSDAGIQGPPTTAASVVITVAGAVGDAETLTITDALGNSVAYTATGSQDLASNPPEFSRSTGGADATADSIKSCIESATYGHGTLYSSLTVDGSASGGAITVRQVYKGTDGNTECDASSVTNVTAVGGTDSTANQFDGGSDGSSVDNNNTLEDFIRDSGSVTFTTFWQSLDESVGYHTGSLKINAPDMTAFDNDPTRYTLNISNLKGSYKTEQKVRLRVVAYNVDEQVKSVKLPLYRPSIVLTKCFYRIRDAYSDDVVIPFDDDDGYDGTLMSTDSKGMYFDIFTDDLNVGRVFAIDIKIKRDNSTQVFKNVGGTFRIDP